MRCVIITLQLIKILAAFRMELLGDFMNIKKDIALFLLVLMTSQGSALALYNLNDMNRSYTRQNDIVKPTLYVYDSAYSYLSLIHI